MSLYDDSIASAKEARDSLLASFLDLTKFIDSDESFDASIDGRERELLRRQAGATRELLDVLNERIGRADLADQPVQEPITVGPQTDAHLTGAANTVQAPEQPVTAQADATEVNPLPKDDGEAEAETEEPTKPADAQATDTPAA